MTREEMNKDTTEYEKGLNEMKEQILKEGNTLLTKRDLLERFCEIDKEYDGHLWNLLQILANINILIGQQPCEDTISRADAVRVASGYCHPSNIANELAKLPSAIPKQRWIPANATNGDMIKAMFPNASVSEKFPIGKYDEVYYVLIEFADGVTNEMRVMKNWWNAPYKGESEDKE